MLILQTLGRLAIVDGGPTGGAAAQPSRLLLLAVLAVAGKRGVSRERLQALLWPDGDAERARKALNQALFALRRDLAEQELVLGTTELRLNPEVITCDVSAFESAVAANEYERAVDMYGGLFLDGVTLRANAEVERWIDRERLRLEHAYQDALHHAARAARVAGDSKGAAGYLKRLAASDPLSTATAVELMHALVEGGDRAGAIAHARVHQLSVRQELDQEPASEVAAYAKTLMAEGATSAETRSADHAIPSESVGKTPEPSASHIAAPQRSTRRAWFLILGAAGLVLLAATFAQTRDRQPPSPTAAPIDDELVSIVSSVPFQDDASTAALARTLVATITRRLTSATSAKIVTLSVDNGADRTLRTRQASARIVVLISAVKRTGPLEVTVSSAAGEQLWNGQMGATGVDSLAERTAAAVAVRLDRNLANWIGNSSQPTSLNSYQEFARGLALYADLRPRDAASHFMAAAQDTTFTMALVLAASADDFAGQSRAADSIVKALQPRRLAILDRAMVDRLAALLNQDLGAEHEASLAVSAAAPKSEWRYQQAESALKLGRSAEAVRVLTEVGPDLGWLRGFSGYWILLDRGLHHLGNYERELSMMTVARARFPTNRIILQDQLKALAALGRVTAIDSTIDYALTLRPKGTWGDAQPMLQTVEELDAHGYKGPSQRLARRTVAWMRVQPPEKQEELAASIPLFLYYAGSTVDSRRELQHFLNSTPNDYDSLALLAVLFSEQGDRAGAHRIDAQLAGITAPELRANLLIDRAQIAAALDDRATAVRMIRDACRAGFEWRIVIHAFPGIVRLRGYPPYEALVGPVE